MTTKKEKLWKGTLAEYNALPKHDDDITYIITDDCEVIDLLEDSGLYKDKTWSSSKIYETLQGLLPRVPQSGCHFLEASDGILKWNEIEVESTENGISTVSLQLFASGSTYKIPENGYILLNKYCTSLGQYISVHSKIMNTIYQHCVSTRAHSMYSLFIPVLKDDELKIEYTFAGETVNFLYVKGDKFE